jgi:hypothetical protein
LEALRRPCGLGRRVIIRNLDVRGVDIQASSILQPAERTRLARHFNCASQFSFPTPITSGDLMRSIRPLQTSVSFHRRGFQMRVLFSIQVLKKIHGWGASGSVILGCDIWVRVEERRGDAFLPPFHCGITEVDHGFLNLTNLSSAGN